MSEPKPRFSIIVPVLNMEYTITRTLESILTQQNYQAEVIVVDGQSKDGTLAAVQQFEQQLSKIISEPDLGLYHAINKGVTAASGEIIAILNGDDYYKHNTVLELYSEEFRRNEAEIVFGDLEFFSQKKPNRTIRTYSSKKFRLENLKFGWMPPHPTAFVKKEVYNRVGLYKTDYLISADYEFMVRALWKWRIAFSRVDSTVVRMQYGGLSTSGLKATYALNQEIIKACNDNGLKTNWINICTKFPKKLLEFWPVLPISSGHRNR